MNYMDLVSVIVPVYNLENQVEKCLESILNQSYTNLEVLLVDDGSKDNSWTVINELAKKDSRVRCIHKENGGAASARNLGIKESKGKYLCFVDGDDFVQDSYVSDLYEAIIEKDSDMAWCDFVRVEKGGKEFQIDQPPSKFYLFEMPSSCNKLFKKSLWIDNDIWYPEGIKYEDVAIIPTLVLIAKNPVWVNKGLYNYVYTPNSVTTTYDHRVLTLVTALDYAYMLFDKFNLLKDEKCKDYIEYMFLNNAVELAFRISLASDLNTSDIKKNMEYIKSKFPNMYKNKYISTQFDFMKRSLMILLQMKMYGLIRLIIRTIR